MKKIIIGYLFSEKNPKREDRLFLESAKEKNIKLVMINTAKELSRENIEKKIKDCSIIYNNSAEPFSLEIVKTIETLGKKVMDSSKKFYYDEDKWMFFLKCENNKIPTLKTILLSQNLNLAKKELKDFNQWPVILKRTEGTMGDYVEKADNLVQAVDIINKFWKKGSERLPIIAQEFVNSPSYRVTVIGDKIVQTALKDGKGWKDTGVYTSHFKKFEIDNELEKIINRLIKVFEINICGIDFFKKDGKWVVLEINAQPGLDFFKKERKTLINKIFNFLKTKI